MSEAISLARKLNDMHGLAVALAYAARLASYERGAAEVERLASELIELSTRYGFGLCWLLDRFFAAGRAALRIAQPKASH